MRTGRLQVLDFERDLPGRQDTAADQQRLQRGDHLLAEKVAFVVFHHQRVMLVLAAVVMVMSVR
jgi:hypothetical protein